MEKRHKDIVKTLRKMEVDKEEESESMQQNSIEKQKFWTHVDRWRIRWI